MKKILLCLILCVNCVDVFADSKCSQFDTSISQGCSVCETKEKISHNEGINKFDFGINPDKSSDSIIYHDEWGSLSYSPLQQFGFRDTGNLWGFDKNLKWFKQSETNKIYTSIHKGMYTEFLNFLPGSGIILETTPKSYDAQKPILKISVNLLLHKYPLSNNQPTSHTLCAFYFLKNK